MRNPKGGIFVIGHEVIITESYLCFLKSLGKKLNFVRGQLTVRAVNCHEDNLWWKSRILSSIKISLG